MKSKTIVFAALLVAAVMALFAPRQAQAGVTFSYFYESLLPYGEWVDVDQYGYCWAPRGVTPDWRPYTDGYWTYTDAGWTWVSYEDFGSITYHYGRWVRLEEAGWVWKPDFRWGPAWVSWRQSDRYMGWAPLPPDVAFNEDNGVGVWVDRDYDIGPSAYSFCETRYFGAPAIRNVIVPVGRNVEILDMTVNITNITYINTRDHGRLVYCGGPDYRWLASRTDRPINRLELVLRTDGDWMHRGRPELSRNAGLQLFIDAPVIEPPHERFAPPHVAREIRAPRIDRGWGIVADPGTRDRIHQRYQEQTRGLTAQSAPAYRVNEAEVRSFVREPRPAQSGAPGAVQNVQNNVQRGSQQPQQAVQQPAGAQPSAQSTQGSHRGPGAGQSQAVQTQPQDRPSAQPTQGSHRGPGAGQSQAVQTQPQDRPSAQPTQGSHRGSGAGQSQAVQTQPQDRPSAQSQATTVPQRAQSSVQAAQTPKAPAQQASQVQRSVSEPQRQATEGARSQQRQTEQFQRNPVEQRQRQASEGARSPQRQVEQPVQRRESAAPQQAAPQQSQGQQNSSREREKDRRKPDRPNEPFNNQ
ncbi:MAG: DUF6600 domain-containing protein [Chthoniobacteraceae bacterium]